MPGYADVVDAAERLRGVARRTPVMTSGTANRLAGAELFFKCENYQRMGAFKFRGAYNSIAQFSDEQKKAGVLTYSSGNHAQAIALSAPGPRPKLRSIEERNRYAVASRGDGRHSIWTQYAQSCLSAIMRAVPY